LDANKKVFLFEFGRKHYLHHQNGSQFDANDYDANINNYVNKFPEEILPFLSVFGNAVGWK